MCLAAIKTFDAERTRFGSDMPFGMMRVCGCVQCAAGWSDNGGREGKDYEGHLLRQFGLENR